MVSIVISQFGYVLVGFHTEMSFLGCIGHLMASSELQEMLDLIYGPNAVVHMLSGKAIARAVSLLMQLSMP